MTTCPDCNRPLATATLPGEEIGADECLSGLWGWQTSECGVIARDLRAKADAALLVDARCFPPGFLAAVAAVLRGGAERHGVAPHETGGGQTREDHLRHAIDHLYGSAMGDDREPHLVNATARLALAWGQEQAGK